MNWQPIETAPKDGAEVDLWVCNAEDERREQKRLPGYVWDKTHNCWRTKEDLHFVNRVHESYRITHWASVTYPADVEPFMRMSERYGRMISRAVARSMSRNFKRTLRPSISVGGGKKVEA